MQRCPEANNKKNVTIVRNNVAVASQVIYEIVDTQITLTRYVMRECYSLFEVKKQKETENRNEL